MTPSGVTSSDHPASRPHPGASTSRSPADPADAWTTRLALAAFVLVFVSAAIAALILGGLTPRADGDIAPGIAILVTAIQDAAMILVPIGLVVLVAGSRPTADAFGLRPLPAKRLLAYVTVAFVAFAGLTAAYDAVLDPGGSQDTLQTLGADRGGVLMIATAVLVIVVAPVAEEFLFRGFMYRAARNRWGRAGGAVIVGLIFGSVHLTDADTAPLIPMLVVLGALACVLYERTGSLAAPIALHVVNNTIAFSFAANVPDAALVGLPAGGAMLTTVVILAARDTSRPRPDRGPLASPAIAP